MTICASSVSDSALLGRRCGPQRPSSASGSVRQRSMLRAEMPSRRHAGASRAPDACAWLSRSSITSRCARSCRRPRPPHRESPLFFEHQERRRFGQDLLLARELALELANALGRRCRGGAALVKRQPPLLVLGEADPAALEIGGQLLTGELGGLGEDAPSARRSVGAPRTSRCRPSSEGCAPPAATATGSAAEPLSRAPAAMHSPRSSW